MKKLFLIFQILLFSTFLSWSQNSVQLNINHKLGANNFSLSTGAENNIRHDFEITRLEYYVSEISIIHDGGQETLIPDLWLLVDASVLTQVDLGNHNITSIEKVIFNIGVDPDHNHLDLTTYDITHPLGPKSPSMHWGWAVGYRFLALEGNGGPNYNQLFELHAMGDEHYFNVEIEVNSRAINEQHVINIDADYRRALENIELNSGVISHSEGENSIAVKGLENFRDFVFSASPATANVAELSKQPSFIVLPNPVTDDIVNILFNSPQRNYSKIIVYDLTGKVVYENILQKNTEKAIFQFSKPGFYHLTLVKDGRLIETQKLIIR